MESYLVYSRFPNMRRLGKKENGRIEVPIYLQSFLGSAVDSERTMSSYLLKVNKKIQDGGVFI